jgi:hypothetical protein
LSYNGTIVQLRGANPQLIRSGLHARVRASNEGLARKPSGEEGLQSPNITPKGW